MGTVAFGALILTIVEIIRMILEAIQNRLRESDNFAAQIFLACFICVYDCLQRAIGFITHNAYIICGLHGTPFCSSTKTAFKLVMRNVLNFYAIDQVNKKKKTSFAITSVHF